MTDWRVEVNDGEEVLTNDDGLYDVEIVDTFNPFGDYATAFFDDLAGNLFDKFQRGTKVVFQYSNDGFSTVNDRFIGYVVNDLPRDSDGAEQLEVEAYSFDQFLRGDEVTNDQTGNTIFEALEDVIKTDVPPVEWDASLVDVEENQELTESYQGDKVEDFLLSIRQKSAGEIFTATEDLKFKFQRAEVERAPRDISNSQWIQHDLGEQGGETKNQVIVFYDDGNEAVIVDNSRDQLNIQDNLGAVGPGQQGESITLPDITNREDAISAGEQFLNGRASTLTGSVTTFDLIDAEPSQVLAVTIDSRGIDGDFRIAENKIRWRNETNELTLVEKKGADDDVLIAQSKTLDRVENRPRDNTVVPDKTTDTDVEIALSVSGDLAGTSFDNAVVTNDGRNAIRDAWIDGSTINVTDIAVGSGTDRPVRSDSALDNELERVTTSTSQATTTSVEYSGAFSADGQNKVAIFADTGDMIAIARLSDTVDGGGTATFTITVDDGTNSDKAVATTTAQEATVDILGNVSAPTTDQYTYGDTSNASIAESDTALTSTVATNDITGVTIQSASTDTEFDSIIVIDEQEPFEIQNDALELAQTTFVFEAEDQAISGSTIVSDVDYSSGDAAQSAGTAETIIRKDIELDYEIPAGEWKLAVRDDINGDGTDATQYNIEIDGTTVNEPVTGDKPTTPVSWQFYDPTDNGNIDDFALTKGTHTIEVSIESVNTQEAIFDLIALADFRYVSTSDFDNTVHQNDGYLDGPPLYPSQQTTPYDVPASSAVKLDSVTVNQTLNDTSNNQSFTITPDGTTFANTGTGSVSYGTERVVEVTVSNTLGVYTPGGTAQNATPRFDYAGQRVEDYILVGDLRAVQRNNIGEVVVRTVVDDATAVGDTFADAGQTDGTDLLTHVRLPEFVKQSDQKVISNEKLRWVND